MIKVLIVEDNKIINNELVNSLKLNFPYWEILGTYNYDDSMLLIEDSIKEGSLIDLFLFDISLDNENLEDTKGFTLANYIRCIEQYKKTPLLFLTAIPDKCLEALSNYHCYDYIKKPYTSTDIINRIEQLLLCNYINYTICITDISRSTQIIVKYTLL